MEIKIISSLEGLQEIQNHWVRLFDLGEYSVFQSFEFNYYSWEFELSKNKLNRLFIILLKNEEVDAIIPLYLDSNKRLRFINDHHADFCDYLSNDVIDFSLLYSYLKQVVDFRSIRLMNVKLQANMYKSIVELNSVSTVIRSISEYSDLSIEKGEFPYNVLHYRSHQKHRINKAYRTHQEKESIIFTCKEKPFPKKDILFLRDYMIKKSIREYNFLTNDRLCLIENLYNAGFLILHFVRDGDCINSCNIMLKNSSKEFMFWIDLYDNLQMINIFSYAIFMKKKSLKYPVTINFGRGRYFYKVSNFAPNFNSLYQLDIFNNNLQKLIFKMVSYFKSLSRSIYKKVK